MEQILNDIINDNSKLIFAVVCLIAFAEFNGGLIFLLKTKLFVKNARRVMADITKLELRQHNKGGKYYKMSLTFKDQLGNQITPPDISVGMKKEYKVGDKIEVLSDKNNPEKIKQDNFLSLYIMPIGMIGGSVSLIIVLIIMVINNIAKLPF